MADPNLQKRRGPGHPDPEIRRRAGIQFFFGLRTLCCRNKGGAGAPWPLSWFRHCKIIQDCLKNSYFQVCEVEGCLVVRKSGVCDPCSPIQQENINVSSGNLLFVRFLLYGPEKIPSFPHKIHVFFVVFVWFSKNIPVWKKYLFSKFGFLFFLLWNYFSKDGKRISIETIITITILGLPQNYTWNRFIQKWK